MINFLSRNLPNKKQLFFTGKLKKTKNYKNAFLTETVRVKYFLDLLVNVRYPVMLVGGAGNVFISNLFEEKDWSFYLKKYFSFL